MSPGQLDGSIGPSDIVDFNIDNSGLESPS